MKNKSLSTLLTLAMALTAAFGAKADTTVSFPASGGVKEVSCQIPAKGGVVLGTRPSWVTKVECKDFMAWDDWSTTSAGSWGNAQTVSFRFTVAQNSSNNENRWVISVKENLSFTYPPTGTEIDRLVIVQAAGSGTQPGPTPPEPGPVVPPVVNPPSGGGTVAYGPGAYSRFAWGGTEQAFVVGVSGLNREDFRLRTYQGEKNGTASRSYYTYDDVNLVDAEKNAQTDSDDFWCPALSDMNLAVWTGWAADAGYTDEDALANYFRSNPQLIVKAINDQWESSVYGQNGVFDWIRDQNPSSMIMNYKTLATTSQSAFASELETMFANADRLLRLCIAFYSYTWKGELGVGHVVTCCGYSVDTTQSGPSRLKGLFIIDSDNDMYNGAGGSSAPNSITYCPVMWNGSSYRVSNVFGTDGDLDLSDAYYLQRKPGGGWTSRPGKPSGKDPTESGQQSQAVIADVPVVEPTGAFSAPSAEKLQGVVFKDGKVFGSLQLKVGKASSKTGESKVSATVYGLDGKKYAAKAVKVPTGETPEATLSVKSLGTLKVTIGENGFSGTLDEMTVTSVEATPATSTGRADFLADNLSSVFSDALTNYFPKAEAVSRTEKKWKVVDKPGKLKLVKEKVRRDKDDDDEGLLPEDADYDFKETGGNIAGLKLTYAWKTQTFKGSFKIWTFNEARLKLKSVKAKVTGVVVNGSGYGQVTVKKVKVGEMTVR